MTTDEMLERISTLLFFNGVWHARARDFSSKFAQGATPREALAAAIDGQKQQVNLPNADLF
jgi:predicted RNase H-like HicB family nuclease